EHVLWPLLAGELPAAAGVAGGQPAEGDGEAGRVLSAGDHTQVPLPRQGHRLGHQVVPAARAFDVAEVDPGVTLELWHQQQEAGVQLPGGRGGDGFVLAHGDDLRWWDRPARGAVVFGKKHNRPRRLARATRMVGDQGDGWSG